MTHIDLKLCATADYAAQADHQRLAAAAINLLTACIKMHLVLSRDAWAPTPPP